MKTPVVPSIGILIARIGIGVIFLAHGLQKFRVWGLDGTAASFEQMEVPAPTASAYAAAFIETIGGIALIAGLLVPLAGILLFLVMAGAFFIVHIDNGIWVADGGYELVLALGMGALLLAAVGAGKFSLDAILFRGRSRVSA
ncbi:DoxX family protein [Rhodococcus triatomae]|uniref:Putative oxidoreductase n=1 Tax=Rhodococcus triatomae TaxID=300028 RepID=A0A1G8A3E2_9NOCA|nr:DoxX family protein [Rhodococcus triatomae]QNG17868.1 DoxX family protein [Rhodococcus triatomae]QNG22464.1 DoxX family protein [Rhodococcus triatomae]SDH15505.1 putative oxidoreductase [Rhodococcus triatomae]